MVSGLNLSDALIAISKKSQINIVFNPAVLPKGSIGVTSYTDQSVRYILNDLLKDTDLKYQITKDQIVITSTNERLKYHRISGFIEDAISGERLPLTNIYDDNLLHGTVSNDHGFYSIRLLKGIQKLHFSYLGYESQVIDISHSGNIRIDIKLLPIIILDEVIIHDADSIDNGLIEQSIVRINTIDLTNQVGIGGENDIANLIRSQSGVQSGADGIGGLSIRGGSEDQNLLLLDGGPIYYPNHIFGIFSAVNSAAIRKTQFSKTNFLSPDGKRLSSVIDVKTKDGSLFNYHGNVGVSLSAITAAVEGPLSQGKSSFVISGRRSLHTPIQIFPTLGGIRDGAQTNVKFYDGTIKWHNKINDRNTLTSHFFIAEDLYKYDLDYSNIEQQIHYRGQRQYQWNNLLAGVKWTSQFSDRVFFHALGNYSSFYYNAESAMRLDNKSTRSFQGNYLSLESNIKDIKFNADWDYYINTENFMQFGVAYTSHSTKPIINSINEVTSEIIRSDFTLDDLSQQRTRDKADIHISQADIYIQDHLSISNKVRMDVGLFVNYLFTQKNNSLILLPKLAFQYRISPKVKWLSTLQKSAQYFHKIDIDQSSFPNSIWIPFGEDISPKTSWLFSSGINWRTSNRRIFDIEVFYNKLNNFYYLGSTPILSLNDDFNSTIEIQKNLNQLGGVAYGVEMGYSMRAKHFTGKLNYTLTYIDRKDIDSGLAVRPALDRRHTANMTITAKTTSGINFTLSGTYGSKTKALYNFNSFSNLFDAYDPSIIQAYEDQYGSSLSENIRLDLSAYIKLGQQAKHLLSLGIYNLTNRKNQLYRFVDEDILLNNDHISNVATMGIRPIASYKLSF